MRKDPLEETGCIGKGQVLLQPCRNPVAVCPEYRLGRDARSTLESYFLEPVDRFVFAAVVVSLRSLLRGPPLQLSQRSCQFGKVGSQLLLCIQQLGNVDSQSLITSIVMIMEEKLNCGQFSRKV